MISKGEFSASYRHIFLNIPDKFPEVLERNSYDLGQQRGRFRTCMQAIQETPLLTVDSFKSARRKGKYSSANGRRVDAQIKKLLPVPDKEIQFLLRSDIF